MENMYNVIFTGKIIEGFSQGQVRENLSKIYGKRGDDQMLNAFFTGSNVILMKNLANRTVSWRVCSSIIWLFLFSRYTWHI